MTVRQLAYVGCLALALAAARPAPAAAQLEPWFLVTVDTSTAMNDNCTNASSPPDCGVAANVCGFARTRMGDARCSLQRMVSASGDAEFGLVHNPSGCTAELAVEILENNQPEFFGWVDGCTASSCPDGGDTNELDGTGDAAPGAGLDLALDYLQNGNPAASPIAGDPEAENRPVSVILITDGNEMCSGDAVASAAALQDFSVSLSGGGTLSEPIDVYVIGYGVSEPDTTIDAIAEAGGTGSGRYASDQGTLTDALLEIIATERFMEVCDGEDNDFDGAIDEGTVRYCDLQGRRTSDAPEQPNAPDPGTVITDKLLCESPGEDCNGIDDDCDGVVDEGAGGGSCGLSIGACVPGTLQCVDRVLTCMGGTQPSDEVCDGSDNDCDTEVDEDDGNLLCGGDSVCVEGACVQLCSTDDAGDERSCPSGMAAQLDAQDRCLCLPQEDVGCVQEDCVRFTLVRDGELVCAPDSDEVARCSCRIVLSPGGNPVNACVGPCDGVTCTAGRVCDPRTLSSECVEDNCIGLGCPEGERCERTTGECVVDPCVDAGCRDDQVCRDGACETSCAVVECEPGQRCERGDCVDDPCSGVECASIRFCDPETSMCRLDMCTGVRCEAGEVCDRADGQCKTDPCLVVVCPEGQVCQAGECDVPAGGEPAQPTSRFTTSGGGGFIDCAVAAPGASGKSPWLWLLALLGLGAIRLGWRSRSRATLLLSLYVVLSFSIWLGGCKEDALCIDCPPEQSADAGMDGAVLDGAILPDGSVEGGPMADCMPERCNGLNDDCDDAVDEDLSPPSICKTEGVCAGTTATCAGLSGWACSYGSDYEQSETVCDDLDNDCDGEVDEGFAQLGQPCARGLGACQTVGVYACDDQGGLRCNADEPTAAGSETCDGIDNDCDGLTDEPASEPGDNASFVTTNAIQLANSLWMMPYEASRPDATDTSGGTASNRACSKQGVLPWRNVTYAEAQAACVAAGMRLCTRIEFQNACTACLDDTTGAPKFCPTTGCGWSYSPAAGDCNDYVADGSNGCNGGERDNPDMLLVTGSLPECYANLDFDFDDPPDGIQQDEQRRIYDLSGNLAEWTSGGGLETRGGSYNNLASGLRCEFEVTVEDDRRTEDIGFRCCSTVDPNQ